MAKLTVKEVLALTKANIPGRYADGGGLYLMIPKRGAPYWMLRYSYFQKRKEMTLSKVGHMSLADARAKSEEAKKLVREGIDPLSERKREQNITIRTVDELFGDWYEDIEKRLKHPRIPRRIYTKEIAPVIGQQKLTSVTPMDIRAIIQKIANSNRPSIANDTLMYCKQLFNHGIKLNLVNSNPAAAFSVTDAGGVEKSRDRALSMDELTAAFRIFRENTDSFSRENYLACALLIVLGVRKSELAEARWMEFDLKKAVWEMPETRSKSGVAITIPLPPQTIVWFEELKVRACGSEYVFPNRRSSKAPHMGKDTLNRAISKLFGREPGRKVQPPNKMGDMEHFTVHDLRRTCRSLLAFSKVPGHVAERCLNHRLKGVEGIYDRYDYFEERKEALNIIADIVSPIVEGKVNTQPFKRKKAVATA